MTDQAALSQPSESQQVRRERKPYILPFHAVIKALSTVKLLDVAQAEIVLNGQPLSLPIAVSQQERIRSNPPQPEQTYLVRLWFRTEEGAVTNLEFAGFAPLKDQQVSTDRRPEFQIAGRIEAINKEEGSITLKIEPNSIGDLQQAFSVEVWAALELMEKLQRAGRTMVFDGEYRPGSGRLVVTSVQNQMVGQAPKKKKNPEK